MICYICYGRGVVYFGNAIEGEIQSCDCKDGQWIEQNTCAVCGMVITNRWSKHKIYGECEKQLTRQGAI